MATRTRVRIGITPRPTPKIPPLQRRRIARLELPFERNDLTLITITQLSETWKLNPVTLNRWEQMGWIPPRISFASGHRAWRVVTLVEFLESLEAD